MIKFSKYHDNLFVNVGGDTGELLAEGCIKGIAHPPGYPLFTLLVYVIKLVYETIYFNLQTILGGDHFIHNSGSYHIAYRVNLTSVLFTTVTGFFICESLLLTHFLLYSNNFNSDSKLVQSIPYTYQQRVVPGLYGSIIYTYGLFAFSPLIWQYAVTSEVFPMNNMFAAFLIYLTLLFAKHRRIEIAYFGAFICGLVRSYILLYCVIFIIFYKDF